MTTKATKRGAHPVQNLRDRFLLLDHDTRARLANVPPRDAGEERTDAEHRGALKVLQRLLDPSNGAGDMVPMMRLLLADELDLARAYLSQRLQLQEGDTPWKS